MILCYDSYLEALANEFQMDKLNFIKYWHWE